MSSGPDASLGLEPDDPMFQAARAAQALADTPAKRVLQAEFDTPAPDADVAPPDTDAEADTPLPTDVRKKARAFIQSTSKDIPMRRKGYAVFKDTVLNALRDPRKELAAKVEKALNRLLIGKDGPVNAAEAEAARYIYEDLADNFPTQARTAIEEARSQRYDELREAEPAVVAPEMELVKMHREDRDRKERPGLDYRMRRTRTDWNPEPDMEALDTSILQAAKDGNIDESTFMFIALLSLALLGKVDRKECWHYIHGFVTAKGVHDYAAFNCIVLRDQTLQFDEIYKQHVSNECTMMAVPSGVKPLKLLSNFLTTTRSAFVLHRREQQQQGLDPAGGGPRNTRPLHFWVNGALKTAMSNLATKLSGVAPAGGLVFDPQVDEPIQTVGLEVWNGNTENGGAPLILDATKIAHALRDMDGTLDTLLRLLRSVARQVRARPAGNNGNNNNATRRQRSNQKPKGPSGRGADDNTAPALPSTSTLASSATVPAPAGQGF